MTDRAKLVRDEIEQSERTRDAVPPSGVRGVRKNRAASSVYSLRLPNRVIAQLNDLADELDVPVSALIRGFIADGLSDRKGGRRVEMSHVLAQLDRDVSELHRLVLPG